jgi:hypothetical protein
MVMEQKTVGPIWLGVVVFFSLCKQSHGVLCNAALRLHQPLATCSLPPFSPLAYLVYPRMKTQLSFPGNMSGSRTQSDLEGLNSTPAVALLH